MQCILSLKERLPLHSSDEGDVCFCCKSLNQMTIKCSGDVVSSFNSVFGLDIFISKDYFSPERKGYKEIKTSYGRGVHFCGSSTAVVFAASS